MTKQRCSLFACHLLSSHVSSVLDMVPFSTQILRSKVWRLFQVDFSLSLPSLTRHMHSGLKSCQVVVVVLVTQSCLTLSDPMDCSTSGSSVHVILQTRILEWVAIPCSRWSSRPRDQTRSPSLLADSLASKPPGSSSLAWNLLKVKLTLIYQNYKIQPPSPPKHSHHLWGALSFVLNLLGIPRLSSFITLELIFSLADSFRSSGPQLKCYLLKESFFILPSKSLSTVCFISFIVFSIWNNLTCQLVYTLTSVFSQYNECFEFKDICLLYSLL